MNVFPQVQDHISDGDEQFDKNQTKFLSQLIGSLSEEPTTNNDEADAIILNDLDVEPEIDADDDAYATTEEETEDENEHQDLQRFNLMTL